MGCQSCGGRTYAEHLARVAKGVSPHRYVSPHGRIG